MHMIYVVDNRGMPLKRRHEIVDFIWHNMNKKIMASEFTQASHTLLFHENGIMQGVGLLYDMPGQTINLQSLCVKIDRRNAGLGSEMLNSLKEHVRDFDYNSIILHVNKSSLDAEFDYKRVRAWYERNGFEQDGENAHECVLRWTKT